MNKKQRNIAEKFDFSAFFEMTFRYFCLKGYDFMVTEEGNNKFLKIGENWEILDEIDVSTYTFMT